MVREWSGLDRLRLDKYCFLIRKMVSKMLRFLNDVYIGIYISYLEGLVTGVCGEVQQSHSRHPDWHNLHWSLQPVLREFLGGAC